jgi:hypothetical protein
MARRTNRNSKQKKRRERKTTTTETMVLRREEWTTFRPPGPGTMWVCGLQGPVLVRGAIAVAV